MDGRPGDSRPEGRVLGVQGLSGGVGASVLVSSLAHRAGRRHRVLAVDTEPWGAGIDLLLGMEQRAGWRWPDLANLRGEPDATALSPELPTLTIGPGSVTVLGWGRRAHRTGPTEPWEIVAALSTRFDLTVIDLPRPSAPAIVAWWSVCDRTVLVSGAGLDQQFAAEVTAGLIPRAAGVVLRTASRVRRPATARGLSQLLRLPVLTRIEADDRVGAALVRGESVGAAGALARRADEVLSAVWDGTRRGRTGWAQPPALRVEGMEVEEMEVDGMGDDSAGGTDGAIGGDTAGDIGGEPGDRPYDGDAPGSTSPHRSQR